MKTLIFDMYGVIIKESYGNLVPFVNARFPALTREYIYSFYIKAQLGQITSEDFLLR